MSSDIICEEQYPTLTNLSIYNSFSYVSIIGTCSTFPESLIAGTLDIHLPELRKLGKTAEGLGITFDHFEGLASQD